MVPVLTTAFMGGKKRFSLCRCNVQRTDTAFADCGLSKQDKLRIGRPKAGKSTNTMLTDKCVKTNDRHKHKYRKYIYKLKIRSMEKNTCVYIHINLQSYPYHIIIIESVPHNIFLWASDQTTKYGTRRNSMDLSVISYISSINISYILENV